MSTLERDKQILDIVAKTYNFQFELGERLDNKLNNYNVINGTITTISIAIALFFFQQISQKNPFYVTALATFFFFFAFFIGALLLGLSAYKPTKFEWYPYDPEKLITDYSSYPNELEVIHTIAASLAKATKPNIERNTQKAKNCNKVFILVIIGIGAMIVFTIIMLFALTYSTKSPNQIIPLT